MSLTALLLSFASVFLPPSTPAGQIQMQVELRQDGRWHAVDIHTVFNNKDELRFTYKASFAGYVRVFNHSSDGQTSSLFPLADATKPEQLQANISYLIPGAKGSFVVAGKPGFDLTKWYVSQEPLGADWQPSTQPPQPSTLLPRCPQEDLPPRRSCLDERAGPVALASRELNLQDHDLTAVITIPDTSRKMVVYEFRVAHR